MKHFVKCYLQVTPRIHWHTSCKSPIAFYSSCDYTVNEAHRKLPMAPSDKVNIANHKGLLKQICRRFRWALGPSIEMQDLEQEALIAGLKACESFDPLVGEWPAYMGVLVHRHLLNFCLTTRGTVNLPVKVQKELHAQGKCSLPRRAFMFDSEESGEELEVGDILETQTQHEGTDALEQAISNESTQMLTNLMDTLGPREQVVLRRHFYGDETKDTIAQSMGISRQRVSQICASAILKLKAAASKENE